MGTMLKKVRYAVIAMLALGTVLPGWASDHGRPVALSVSLEGEYNDNRDGSLSDTEETFNTKLQPRASFTYDVGSSYANVYLMPYVLVRSNSRDDQNSSEVYWELGVALRHEITPLLAIRASHRFSRTDDPRVTEAGVTVREDATYNHNVLNVGMDAEIAPLTKLSVGGQSVIKRYDKSDLNDYDEDKLGADLRLERELGAMINAVTTLQYTRSKYHGDMDRGAQFILASLGLEKTFSPNLSGYIHLGWNTAYHNEVPGSKGRPAGNARITVSPTPDTSLSLSGRYELVDSDWFRYSTQERTSLAATLNHRFTPTLKSDLSLIYARGSYKSNTSMGATRRPDGNDDMIAARVGAALQLHRNVGLELGYQVEDWDSDIRDSFTRNKVSLALRASM